MRKTILLFLMIVTTGVWAQEQRLTDLQRLQSSISIEYGTKKPKENGQKIGVDLVYKHLLIGGSYRWLDDKIEDGSYKKDRTQAFDVHIGGNYRYFAYSNDFFDLYLEGRVLLGYNHTFWNYVSGTKTARYETGFGRIKEWHEEKSDIKETYGKGQYYVGVTPRIGFNFGDVSLVVGYRWDFNEFKFDKENKGDYFTIGLAYIF